MTKDDARFFTSQAAFRRWLEANHARAAFVWLGFHRKSATYANRFTPRKPGSIWSRINIAHVERLTAAGLMHPAGLAAFARRDPARSGVYSFEQRPERFPDHHEARLRSVEAAWQYFSEQPPGYRRLAIWWVISAKREATQLRRLDSVIDASARGVRLGVLFGQTGTASNREPRRQ